MSEPANSTIEDVFDELDIDKSGALSDRELRILATRIYDLPLDLKTLEGLESVLINCSTSANASLGMPRQDAVAAAAVTASAPRHEIYYEKQMPQVTLDLISKCKPITTALEKHIKTRTKYKYEVLGEDDIVFKMLNANVSQVVAILDEVRRQPRKFICLNDNIDYRHDSARTVKIVLRDFYESFLPKPSRFELSREYRNRFLHINELREWWRYRAWLRLFTQGVFVMAVAFTLISFFSDRMHILRRRWLRR
jgi:UDP-N-acetylglucosamine-lysosomal-enzyme